MTADSHPFSFSESPEVEGGALFSPRATMGKPELLTQADPEDTAATDKLFSPVDDDSESDPPSIRGMKPLPRGKIELPSLSQEYVAKSQTTLQTATHSLFARSTTAPLTSVGITSPMSQLGDPESPTIVKKPLKRETCCCALLSVMAIGVILICLGGVIWIQAERLRQATLIAKQCEEQKNQTAAIEKLELAYVLLQQNLTNMTMLHRSKVAQLSSKLSVLDGMTLRHASRLDNHSVRLTNAETTMPFDEGLCNCSISEPTTQASSFGPTTAPTTSSSSSSPPETSSSSTSMVITTVASDKMCAPGKVMMGIYANSEPACATVNNVTQVSVESLHQQALMLEAMIKNNTDTHRILVERNIMIQDQLERNITTLREFHARSLVQIQVLFGLYNKTGTTIKNQTRTISDLQQRSTKLSSQLQYFNDSIPVIATQITSPTFADIQSSLTNATQRKFTSSTKNQCSND
jgi:hypothetical protein